MWVPFAILLGLFSLGLGGFIGHRVATNECEYEKQQSISIPVSKPIPEVPSSKVPAKTPDMSDSEIEIR